MVCHVFILTLVWVLVNWETLGWVDVVNTFHSKFFRKKGIPDVILTILGHTFGFSQRDSSKRNRNWNLKEKYLFGIFKVSPNFFIIH